MSGRRAGGLERWVPGLPTPRGYRRSWLVSDLVAGLILSSMQKGPRNCGPGL